MPALSHSQSCDGLFAAHRFHTWGICLVHISLSRGSGGLLLWLADPAVPLEAPLAQGCITPAVTVLQRSQPVLEDTHFLPAGFSSCLEMSNGSMYLWITQLRSTLGFSQAGHSRAFNY